MKLKIVSTGGLLYSGDVREVVVPTQDGEIGILPKHEVYAAVIKGGICKFKPEEEQENFIKSGDYSVISIGDGAVYTDGESVSIAVSSADSKIDISEEELEKRSKELEKEIEEIKTKGSVEDLEKALFKMNKIQADIKLKKKFL